VKQHLQHEGDPILKLRKNKNNISLTFLPPFLKFPKSTNPPRFLAASQTQIPPPQQFYQ